MAAKNQVAPAARILRPTLACLRQPRVGHPPSQLSPFAVLAVCQDNNTSPPTMRPLMCFKRENAKSGYFPFRHGRLRTSRFPSFSTCVFLSTPTERATRALGHLRPYLSSHLSTIHLFTLWLPDMKTTVLPPFGGGQSAASALVSSAQRSPRIAPAARPLLSPHCSIPNNSPSCCHPEAPLLRRGDLLFFTAQLYCFQEFPSNLYGPKNLRVFHSLSC
jgi:hypothetical protein